MAAKKEQPRITEINIHCSAGGKVQIEDFGKITSDYNVSMSRRYEIPEGWSDEDVKAFQEGEYSTLRSVVDERADHEFNERYKQSHLNPDRVYDD